MYFHILLNAHLFTTLLLKCEECYTVREEKCVETEFTLKILAMFPIAFLGILVFHDKQFCQI